MLRRVWGGAPWVPWPCIIQRRAVLNSKEGAPVKHHCRAQESTGNSLYLIRGRVGRTRGWLPKPNISVIKSCCSSRLAVVQAPCSEDDPASLVYFPPYCSPSEGSLSLAFARLLMENFLWLDMLSQSVRAHCALPTLNLLCVVRWGSGWHLDFYLLVLCDHFAFVEYVYIIKLWLFCLGEFLLKSRCKDSICIRWGPLGRTTLSSIMLLGLRKKPPLKWGRRKKHSDRVSAQFPKSLQ